MYVYIYTHIMMILWGYLLISWLLSWDGKLVLDCLAYAPWLFYPGQDMIMLRNSTSIFYLDSIGNNENRISMKFNWYGDWSGDLPSSLIQPDPTLDKITPRNGEVSSKARLISRVEPWCTHQKMEFLPIRWGLDLQNVCKHLQSMSQ